MRTPGEVRVKVWRDGCELCIEVRNPVGDPRDMAAGYGIGLTSVQERLASLYGSERPLRFERSTDGNVRVTVIIPLRDGAAVEQVAP